MNKYVISDHINMKKLTKIHAMFFTLVILQNCKLKRINGKLLHFSSNSIYCFTSYNKHLLLKTFRYE